MKTVLFIFSVIFLQQLLARSVQKDEFTRLDGELLKINEKQINYLINYGYLDKISVRSQKEMIRAIRVFQNFYSLPVTGVIDEATSELMKAPRCGNQDVFNNKARFVLSPSGGWGKKHLTYYLENVTEPLELEEAAKFMKIALDHWSSASKLNFTRVYDTSADIRLNFREADHGDGYPFQADRNDLAHAGYPKRVLQGQIHFWELVNWTFHTESNKAGTDFYSALLHELGHTLGLEHSKNDTAVMHSYYRPIDPTHYLPYDDVLGMYHLYLKNPPPDTQK